MKTSFKFLQGVVLAGASLCNAMAGPVDLPSAFAKAQASQQPVAISLDMGHGWKIPAQIDVTQQGNGTLSVANLTLRLMDRHDDGVIYREGSLRLDLVPLGAAPYASLVVSGIVVHTGEKESDPTVERSVVVLYQLDCKHGQFQDVFNTSDVRIDLNTTSSRRVKCPVVRSH